MQKPVRGLSFGPAAQLYDRYRPSYPAEALRFGLGDSPLRVVDLGAGTGILTRAVQALGHDVTAVEPDQAMIARLTEATPGIQALQGSAEAIPLPDGFADAVVAGQAYHWFSPARAHTEIARVLRAGGVFAAIWNVRDEREPWVAALSRVADDLAERRADGESVRLDRIGLGPRFGPVERAIFDQSITMTTESLVAMMSTRSYYLISTPQRQREIEAAIRNLVADQPERFELPYVTEVYRAVRR